MDRLSDAPGLRGSGKNHFRGPRLYLRRRDGEYVDLTMDMDLVLVGFLPSRRLRAWILVNEWMPRACVVNCLEPILDVRQEWRHVSI